MPWGVVAAVAGAATSSLLAPDPSPAPAPAPASSGPAPTPTPSGGGGGGNQSLGGALGNLYLTSQGANKIQQAGNTAAQMSDPFSQSRQLANTQLQSLMQNPGQMQNDPSYQWALQQGGQAVDRSLAARHMNASGGALQELTQFGQGLASQQYNNRLNQLYQMASQGANPAAAGQQFLNATETAQSGLNAGQSAVMASASPLISSAGNSLGNAVGQGISGLINQWGASSSASPTDMTGFQNTSYQPNYFGSTPTGGTYDYSTSYGSTPSYTGSTDVGYSSWGW